MRTTILISTLFLLLCSCNKKKESCYSNFTYSMGNIKESYHLKFNSSDTVYYEDTYFYQPKKGLFYFVLEPYEKETLDSLICRFEFPKDTILLNNHVNDGTTICFDINNHRLSLHETGPKEFWKFQEEIELWLEHIQLRPTNKKVKFADFRPMFALPKIEK